MLLALRSLYEPSGSIAVVPPIALTEASRSRVLTLLEGASTRLVVERSAVRTLVLTRTNEATMFIYQGDTEPDIDVTLKDKNGPVSLTGKVIYASIQLENGTKVIKVLTAHADLGRATYAWASAAETRALPVGAHRYFVTMVGSGEEVTWPDPARSPEGSPFVVQARPIVP